MKQQTEAQAYRANAQEWARSLTNEEISRLLSTRRADFTPAQLEALIAEENRRRT